MSQQLLSNQNSSQLSSRQSLRDISENPDFEHEGAAKDLISEVLNDREFETQNSELVNSMSKGSELIFRDVDMSPEIKNVARLSKAAVIKQISGAEAFVDLLRDTLQPGSSEYLNSFPLRSTQEFNDEIRLKLQPLVKTIASKTLDLKVPLFLPLLSFCGHCCF